MSSLVPLRTLLEHAGMVHVVDEEDVLRYVDTGASLDHGKTPGTAFALRNLFPFTVILNLTFGNVLIILLYVW